MPSAKKTLVCTYYVLPQGFSDDKAFTSIRLHCTTTDEWQESNFHDDGDWDDAESCPQPSTTICGLKTRLEAPHASDNTSLNGVEFQCCIGEDYYHTYDCINMCTFHLFTNIFFHSL